MTSATCHGCTRAPFPPCASCRLEAAATDTLAAFPEPARRGRWSVEPFQLTADEVRFAQLRSAASGAWRETYDLLPGAYVRLVFGSHTPGAFDRTIVMSTTPMELRTNREAVEHAQGNVLIGGLGLGIVARAIRELPIVGCLTVLERDPDVIALVAPTLPAGIHVVQGDVTTWTPPAGRYTFVWLDIWSDVPNRDDWQTMKALRRRWRRWAPAAGAIRCWRESEARER